MIAASVRKIIESVLYCRATVVPGGAAALLRRLPRIYLGPDVIFPIASPW